MQIFILFRTYVPFHECTSDDKYADNTITCMRTIFDGINYTFPYFCNFCIKGHTNIRPPATKAGLLWQTPAKKRRNNGRTLLHCDLFSRSMRPYARNTCEILNSIPCFWLYGFYYKSTNIKIYNVRKIPDTTMASFGPQVSKNTILKFQQFDFTAKVPCSILEHNNMATTSRDLTVATPPYYNR